MTDPFRTRCIADTKLKQNGVTPPAIIEASTGYGVPFEEMVIRPLEVHIPYFRALIASANTTPTPLVEELMEQVKVIAEAETRRNA